MPSIFQVALALAGMSAVAAPAPSADEIAVRTVRFYRAADGQTRVWAFVTIPRPLVSRASRVDPGYGISIRVSDSTGFTLHRETWRQHPSSARAGASVELLHFAVAPGAYRLEVEVTDGGTARPRYAAVELDGYATDPGASDLVLAPAMRIDPDLDAPVGPGEFRHGSTIISPTAQLRLSPSRTRAYYLLEAYLPDDAGASGTMEVAVTDRQGATLVRTPPVNVTLDPGGGVLRGQVDLEGLPPGRYRMTVLVRLGEREFERSGELAVDATDPAPVEAPEVIARRLGA